MPALSPKRLFALGFPFDFKFSLETKVRSIAIRRSQPIISAILHSLDNFCPDRESVRDMCAKISSLIQSIKKQFCDTGILPEPVTIPVPLSRPRMEKSSNNSDKEWLQAFIASKEKAQISRLSVHQLNQRTQYFLNYLKKQQLTLLSLTSSEVVEFSNHLQTRNQSAKTKKDYWQATKQFVKWLVMKGHLERNPFNGVKSTFRTREFASQQRQKWSHEQLYQLLASARFQYASDSFRWTALLLIYMGCRPSEVCQLRVNDIRLPEATITITDRHPQQTIKNKHALRTLPIHQTLLDMGFLDYVALRTSQGFETLFDWKPIGQDMDWSKGFRVQFGRLQTEIGMAANSRPTAYGFRHTFIDTLKQTNVAEHEVAEVVGHAHANMTYGRYGKPLSKQALKAVIERFELDVFYPK